MGRIMVTCKDGPLNGLLMSVDDDVEAFTGINNMPEGFRYALVADTLSDLVRDEDIIKADAQFHNHDITKVATFEYEEIPS